MSKFDARPKQEPLDQSHRYKLHQLMAQRPQQWGLRGDPFLWDAMFASLQDTPLPATAAELDALIAGSFEAITGRSMLNTAEAFFVEQFAHGGMSSGYVDPRWWRETALPLLRGRLSLFKVPTESCDN